MKRATDWPRYLESRRLASGQTAWYWIPPRSARKAGFTLAPEALGTRFAAAAERARMLNEHLDAWRNGRGLPKGIERPIGTVDWWIAEFLASPAARRLASRTQRDYREALCALAGVPTKLTDASTGQPARTGSLPVSSLSLAAVDKLYEALRQGGRVTRRADYAIDVARRAWKVVRRLHPGLFLVPVVGTDGNIQHLALNPFEKVERADYERDTAVPVTRAEVMQFLAAAQRAGHPAIGVAALISFEWHQRPEDVRKGRVTWTDYRPAERPTKVLVCHRKTRRRVWKLLEADGQKLYPELEAAIARLPRLGVPMIMLSPSRGPRDESGRRTPRLYSEPYTQHLVQKIRKAAGLPAHFTLEACRHGGLTELGDAELTEQETMTLSTHATPRAARLYVKRTERQERNAALKRRRWVEVGS